MIVAFQEISSNYPKAIAGEEDSELLDGENYRKIFELWCEKSRAPLVVVVFRLILNWLNEAPKLPWSTLSFIDPAIFQRAKEAAKGTQLNLSRRSVTDRIIDHFTVDLKHRRARYLLQSSGMTRRGFFHPPPPHHLLSLRHLTAE